MVKPYVAAAAEAERAAPVSQTTEWARGKPVSTAWARLANELAAWGPPLLFGLRLWASVCLALYVAFWLELDNAYWAGTRRRSSANHNLARRCARAGFA